MRAQINRSRRNRRLILISVVIVVAAVIVVGAYYLSTLTTPGSSQIGKPLSNTDYQNLYSVAQNGYGTLNQTLTQKIQNFNGTLMSSGTKPVIVYIGADYCPYCAFQRWPLVMALMRFGNFTNLAYMESSPTDIYANSPTFSFYGSTYTSKYIVFQGYEEVDRSGQNALQAAPSNYSAVFQKYGGSYPFIDFANKYVTVGSFYFPDQLDGKNWTQIIQLLSSNNVLSNEVISSANAITAAICKVTPNAPSSVCSNGSISALTSALVAYHPSGGLATDVGMQLANQIGWDTSHSTAETREGNSP